MPISRKTLAKYRRDILIETGTLTGETVQAAIDLGFKRIYSIELSKPLANRCKERFKGLDFVTIVQGDSSTELEKILKSVDEPCVFWLDAHYSGGETAKGDKDCPLYEEIAAIASHYIKSHIILIDDIVCLRGDPDPKDERVVACGVIRRLKDINCNYKILYEDGTMPDGSSIKDDILVAII
jgi:hypothetical protein